MLQSDYVIQQFSILQDNYVSYIGIIYVYRTALLVTEKFCILQDNSISDTVILQVILYDAGHFVCCKIILLVTQLLSMLHDILYVTRYSV